MIRTLLEGNRRFVAEVFEKDWDSFTNLNHEQNPTVLWIGCSDSRVPVNTITQTKAGEVFAHRNVGNIVATNDWNLSAVLEFSIIHLHIPDIVVCGHYGCGGIRALDDDNSDDLRHGLRRDPRHLRLGELNPWKLGLDLTPGIRLNISVRPEAAFWYCCDRIRVRRLAFAERNS